MIEKMWEILTTFTKESRKAAMSKCDELEFDKTRGAIPLDESYINLDSTCNILRDAIEQKKLIQLPLSIQNIFFTSLESIARFQTSLISGTDEVVNLADAIEKLNVLVWQYGLHNLSTEVLGYQTKLNQLKSMELAVVKTQKELEKGILIKNNLEDLLNKAETESESIKTLMEGANTSANATDEALVQATDSNEKMAEHLATTQLNVEESTQLLATSTQSNTDIQAYRETITELVSVFTTLKTDLEANKTTQEELFSEFEGFRDKIDGLLADANRTGMAASFTTRKLALVRPMIIWLVIFVLSIIGLLYMGTNSLAPIIATEDFQQLPFRLMLTAPFVWLGWFAAKQYGYTSRLREDYAYKEASAKCFEGYKREASQVDNDMLKTLLETAIKNLGDNPIRIYNGHENHASPLHELLERSLKDKKLVELLKATVSNTGG